MKAKIKLGLQYVTMEVKRKENKRKGFMEEVEFAINLKDRQNFRKDRRVRTNRLEAGSAPLHGPCS